MFLGFRWDSPSTWLSVGEEQLLWVLAECPPTAVRTRPESLPALQPSPCPRQGRDSPDLCSWGHSWGKVGPHSAASPHGTAALLPFASWGHIQGGQRSHSVPCRRWPVSCHSRVHQGRDIGGTGLRLRRLLLLEGSGRPAMGALTGALSWGADGPCTWRLAGRERADRAKTWGHLTRSGLDLGQRGSLVEGDALAPLLRKLHGHSHGDTRDSAA